VEVIIFLYVIYLIYFLVMMDCRRRCVNENCWIMAKKLLCSDNKEYPTHIFMMMFFTIRFDFFFLHCRVVKMFHVENNFITCQEFIYNLCLWVMCSFFVCNFPIKICILHKMYLPFLSKYVSELEKNPFSIIIILITFCYTI
jgi:hypothetical protein